MFVCKFLKVYNVYWKNCILGIFATRLFFVLYYCIVLNLSEINLHFKVLYFKEGSMVPISGVV